MDEREELRRLIDVIERGSATTSVEQAIDDIRTFANTASFLANKLDTRLKQKKTKPRAGKKRLPQPPSMPVPQPAKPRRVEPQQQASAPATSSAITQADYDRLKPIAPQSPISAG
jgi:hypothetical protein